MIDIVILAPYESIRGDIEQAVGEYTPPEPIQTSVYAMTADQISGNVFQADVVIARGFSAEVLRQRYPDLMVVPLQISAYDVFEAVAAAVRDYGASHIALIGLPETVQVADRLGPLLGVELRSYPAGGVKDLEALVDKAKQDGCDCFVGGLSLMHSCREGEKCVLLQTGKSAVAGSLEEAIRLVRSTREERARSLQYLTILDHTKEGIVSLGENRRVTSINRFALRYLGLEDGSACIGRPAYQLMEFAQGDLQVAYSTGRPTESEVYEYKDKLLAVNCVPLRQGRLITGCIVFLRSVNRLQNDEYTIRKKLQARGQKSKYRFEDIIYRSPIMGRAVEKARIYAQVESPVLIVGESGTGKELFAQGIHSAGARSNGPFIAINCAALSENLLESELFGYSDGAFTGAIKGGKAGLFEAAHGGTLFLDEISEIPIAFQSKLLRAIQENEVRRVGSQRVVYIDVRIIAATNRSLEEQVEKGLFRQDLLFRLNVLYLKIPPLRQRTGDMMELFRLFTEEFAVKYKKRLGLITKEASLLLERHGWQGNVRELRNIAERICVLCREDSIDEAMVREALYGEGADSAPPRIAASTTVTNEREHIRMLLTQLEGNRGRVAQTMGIDRSTLWRKMKKYQLA